MSNDNKKSKRNPDAEVVFKILEGSIGTSDFATFCLLVPESTAMLILEALKGAKNKMFEWMLCEEEIHDVQNIPAALAHPIRSIDTKQLPKDMSETELLDWLIHGESYFSKKYVILDFMDGKRGPFDGHTGKAAFEITKKEHMPLFEAAETICSHLSANGDDVYLVGVELLDRGEFRREFGTRKPIIVDDDCLQSFQDDCNSDDVGEWAWNNRDLATSH